MKPKRHGSYLFYMIFQPTNDKPANKLKKLWGVFFVAISRGTPYKIITFIK